MRRAAIAVALVLAAAMAPAAADVRIKSSGGGTVGTYLDFFLAVRQSGERVIIDGPCYSACTLVLSTIPRRRICVTPNAVLAFHAPVLVDKTGRARRSSEATSAVLAAYPPRVRAWIARHGGLRGGFIYLRGKELTAMYRRC